MSLKELSAWAAYKKQFPLGRPEEFENMPPADKNELISKTTDLLDDCRPISPAFVAHVEALGGVEDAASV